VVIIADNRIVANTHGHRQHQRGYLLRHRDNLRAKPGFNPGIHFNNYTAIFVHHDLAARVAVYFYLHARA
jgi:hypothetical protein